MLLTTTNNNLFDTFFSDPWFNDPWFDDRDVQKAQKKLYGHNGKRMMLTDIKESDKGYELEMDLPGFKKDEKFNSTLSDFQGYPKGMDY